MRMRFYGALFLVVGAYGHATTPPPETPPTALQQVKQPNSPLADLKNPTVAEKKSTWVRTKKHLKRYWRRYALAIAATLIAADQLYSRRTQKTPVTEQLTSMNPPSPLDRLIAHQYQLILRILAWSPKPLLRRLQKKCISLKNHPRETAKLLSKQAHQLVVAAHNSVARARGLPIQAAVSEIYTLPEGTTFHIPSRTFQRYKVRGRKKCLTQRRFSKATEERDLQEIKIVEAARDSSKYAIDSEGVVYAYTDTLNNKPMYLEAHFNPLTITQNENIIGFDQNKNPIYFSGFQRHVKGIDFLITSLSFTNVEQAPRDEDQPIAHYNQWGKKIEPIYDQHDGKYKYLGIPWYDSSCKPLSSRGFSLPSQFTEPFQASKEDLFLYHAGTRVQIDKETQICCLGHFTATTSNPLRQHKSSEQKILQRLAYYDVARHSALVYLRNLHSLAVDENGTLYYNSTERLPHIEDHYVALPGPFPIGYDKNHEPLYPNGRHYTESKDSAMPQRWCRYNTTKDFRLYSKDLAPLDTKMPIAFYDKYGEIDPFISYPYEGVYTTYDKG